MQLGLATSPPVSSPPLQPESLNLAPVQLPTPKILPSDNTTIPHPGGSDPINPPAKLPQFTPTFAETGVPKSAGPDGPGPASGSLLELKAEHSSQGGALGHSTSSDLKKYESAEDEKKRLEREERERILKQGPSTAALKFETAEGSSNTNSAPDEDQDELPPYKEF